MPQSLKKVGKNAINSSTASMCPADGLGILDNSGLGFDCASLIFVLPARSANTSNFSRLCKAREAVVEATNGSVFIAFRKYILLARPAFTLLVENRSFLGAIERGGLQIQRSPGE